jgi:hypothetical protein
VDLSFGLRARIEDRLSRAWRTESGFASIRTGPPIVVSSRKILTEGKRRDNTKTVLKNRPNKRETAQRAGTEDARTLHRYVRDATGFQPVMKTQ